MKKDDLKNKLDQRPISFDRDKLWDRINEQPKKKKRRPIWLWFFGSGMALLMIISVSYWTGFNSASNKSESNTIESVEQTKANSNIESSVAHQEANIKNKVNHNEDLSDAKTINKIDSEKSKPSKIEANAIDLTNTTKGLDNIESPTISKNNLSPTNRKPINTNIRFGSNLNQSKNEQLANEPKSKNDNISILNPKTNQQQNQQNEIVASSTNKTISLHSIEGLSISKLIHNEFIDLELELNKIIPHFKVSVNQSSNNELRFEVGIGNDRHTFLERDIYDRKNFEQNLENISAGLTYSRNIYKNLFLSAGFQFTTSQTRTNSTFLNPQVYVQSFDDRNTYIITTETTTKFYNRYSRYDIKFGLGYTFEFRSWNIQPTIGLGSNIIFKHEGDVLDEQNQFISHEDLDLYKNNLERFHYYELTVSKEVSKSINIGIGVFKQGKTDLSIQQNGHSINPVSFKLFLSKRW